MKHDPSEKNLKIPIDDYYRNNAILWNHNQRKNMSALISCGGEEKLKGTPPIITSERKIPVFEKSRHKRSEKLYKLLL